MNLREIRFIRQSAVLALAGSLSAVASIGQQSAPPASQEQAARQAEAKTVPTPGIPSTGFAGLDQYRASRAPMLLDDYGQLARYRAADEELLKMGPVKDRVVFFGDSITDMWKLENNFQGKPYVNRGIGGQTTPQMLVRFRQDVIDLHPAAVVILEGTNDIAGNSGPMTPEMSENNWRSMAELAKANGIRVICTSITPSTDFPWHRGVHPAEKIRAANAWLKEYCTSHSLGYADFYPLLANAEGGMKAELTVDGVHPNAKGYAAMAPVVQSAIDEALRSR